MIFERTDNAFSRVEKEILSKAYNTIRLFVDEEESTLLMLYDFVMNIIAEIKTRLFGIE